MNFDAEIAAALRRATEELNTALRAAQNAGIQPQFEEIVVERLDKPPYRQFAVSIFKEL